MPGSPPETLNFNGAEITILYRLEQGECSGEQNGEIVNDATTQYNGMKDDFGVLPSRLSFYSFISSNDLTQCRKYVKILLGQMPEF